MTRPASEYSICSRCGYPESNHRSIRGRKICPEVCLNRAGASGSGRRPVWDESSFEVCSRCGVAVSSHAIRDGKRLCPEVSS